MFKKILVATDFSKPSRSALLVGLELAKRSMVPLDLVHVLSYMEDIYAADRFVVPTYEWQNEMEKQLNDFFPQEMYPNSHRQILLGSSITEEIVKYARSQGCGLIVVGSHGRGAVGRLLLGSLTQQLSRISEIPVMTVRALHQTEKGYQGFDRVLAPTDFSDASMKAIDYATNFANFLKADLHLIHVVDMPALKGYASVYSEFLQLELDQPSKLNVDTTLKQMVANKQMVGNLKVASLVGEPVDEILGYADKQEANFIVMASHGRKGLERLLLGSVTAGVVARSRIPVITMAIPD